MLSNVHLIVIGFIALVVIAGIIYLIADNRAYKKRMYEAASRRKSKKSTQPKVEEFN